MLPLRVANGNQYKRKFLLLIILTFISIIIIMRIPTTLRLSLPIASPLVVSEQTITPLKNTKHLLVSAFMDQRVTDQDVRIIGIFRRDAIQKLYCVFFCAGVSATTSPATVVTHTDHFGFPFVTTDVLCKTPQKCAATHVTLVPHIGKDSESNQTWLPIRNRKSPGIEEKKLNFTVCISNLFGDYNNVLQFAQTLEMYRLLGVDRVVIYNTSCGPELDRLLQSYSQEGFVEMIQWPIDKHLNPSHHWLFSESGGDLHYFGQLTTLNECIYRSMERSRYVLLNDIDEIITPYQHKDLPSLMNALQQQQPEVGVFYIENHIFPKIHFEPSGKFHLPQWNGVPGVNILEHVYREEPDRKKYHPQKIIVRPSSVEQTSVHEVLKFSGKTYKVPPEVCRIVHVRVPLRGLKLEQHNVDKRLWDFHEELIPRVDSMLRKVGLIS